MSFVSVRMSEEEIEIVNILAEKFERLLGAKPKRHWVLKHLIAKGLEAVRKGEGKSDIFKGI